MAKIKQGVFGAVQGKIGNLVGSSYKGIPVLKAKAASVSNPQTAGQVAQRDSMTSAVIYAKLFLSIWIKPLFDRFAVKMSGYNLWVKNNIANFDADGIIVPGNLVMSVGNMTATAINTAVLDEDAHTAVVTWTTDTTGFHLATDIAYIMLFNGSNESVASSAIVVRSTATATVTIPSDWQETDTVHVWLAFKRANGLYISLASYLGINLT